MIDYGMSEKTEARVAPTTAQGVAREFDTTIPTVHSWYRKGIIPALVHEGRVIRFNLEQVRVALAERAAFQQKGGKS